MMHFSFQSLIMILVLAAVCMMGTGCATIYELSCQGDNSRNVVIRTKPEGADIYSGRLYLGKSPCSVFVNLKKSDGVDYVRIEKDGEYVGHLQMTEKTFDQDTFDVYSYLDLLTIVPMCIDVICLIPIFMIRYLPYDNPNVRIVYDGREIRTYP